MAACDALLVDDEPVGRDALAQLLIAHGYTVRQAANGRIALDMIAERMPFIMVLDLEMPVIDGWEVIASLRRAGTFDAMIVVVLSATTSPPLGVMFMRKPCEIDELLNMIRRSDEPRGAGA